MILSKLRINWTIKWRFKIPGRRVYDSEFIKSVDWNAWIKEGLMGSRE